MAEANRAHFDWDAIRRRLEPAALHESNQVELGAVFRARAVALAQRAARTSERSEVPHLGFRVAGVRFAISVVDVKTCLLPSWVTRIPCASAHLASVIHVQGRIVSVLDLGALFGLSSDTRPAEREARVILVEALGKVVGVWAAQLDGILTLDPTALDTARTQGSRGAEFLRGITADMTLVLAATELVRRAKSGASDGTR